MRACVRACVRARASAPACVCFGCMCDKVCVIPGGGGVMLALLLIECERLDAVHIFLEAPDDDDEYTAIPPP